MHTRVERFILIDDSRIDNFVNLKMVERTGIAQEILVFTKAKKALEFLADIETPIVDTVILLDVVMPEMNGFEFLAAFSRLPEVVKNNCRILVLSSMPVLATMKASVEYPQVLDWLQKPLLESNVVRMMQVLDLNPGLAV